MLTRYSTSHYGESIVVHERFENATEYDMRMAMVAMSVVFGVVQLGFLILSSLQIPCRRLVQTLIVCTVLCQTFHFADNIFMPAKHHEPAWLYQPLIVAQMDKTFLYQFVFLLSLNFATRLLSQPLVKFAKTNATHEQNARRSKRRRMTGWIALLLFGAAQLLTAGHLLVDPLSAYVFDAALSIVAQSMFGLAIFVASLGGLFFCYATPLEIQLIDAIESGKKG